MEGLSHTLPALSFEFTTISRGITHRCLDRLMQLGPYEFNLSYGEQQRLIFPHWISAAQIADHIRAMDDNLNSGDIYAKCMP